MLLLYLNTLKNCCLEINQNSNCEFFLQDVVMGNYYLLIYISLLFIFFPTQGSNPGLPALWADALPFEPLEKPFIFIMNLYFFLKKFLKVGV